MPHHRRPPRTSCGRARAPDAGELPRWWPRRAARPVSPAKRARREPDGPGSRRLRGTAPIAAGVRRGRSGRRIWSPSSPPATSRAVVVARVRGGRHRVPPRRRDRQRVLVDRAHPGAGRQRRPQAGDVRIVGRPRRGRSWSVSGFRTSSRSTRAASASSSSRIKRRDAVGLLGRGVRVAGMLDGISHAVWPGRGRGGRCHERPPCRPSPPGQWGSASASGCDVCPRGPDACGHTTTR